MRIRRERFLIVCALLCLFLLLPMTVFAIINVDGEADDFVDKLNELTEGATIGRDANGNLTITGAPTNEFGKRLQAVIVSTHTMTVTAVMDGALVAVGAYSGNGRQTIDLDDIDAFADPSSGLPTDGAVMIHEIYELFNSVKDGETTPIDEDGGVDYNAAHTGSAREAENAVSLEESGITRTAEYAPVGGVEFLPDGSRRVRVRAAYDEGGATIFVTNTLIISGTSVRFGDVMRAAAPAPGGGFYFIVEEGVGLRLYNSLFDQVDFIALDNPSYLEIDLLGNLYVSEQELDTVLVFEVFDDTLLGPAEIGHPALNDPQGIAVSLLNKSIFVGSDDHIFVFDLGGSFVTSYTHPLLQDVRGLEVDRNGYLYASSFAGDAVLVLEPMFGELVTALMDPQLDGPTGIAIDQLGNIWVGSFNNNRVIRFQPDGDFDGALQVADLLLAPTGVALTPQSVVVEGVEPGLLVGNFHETLLISSSGAGQVLQLDPESGVLLDSVAVGVPSGVAAMENPPPLYRSFLPVVAKGG